MGTKILRYQNQELIYFDQILKREAVTLSNPNGIKFVKNQIVPQEGGLYSSKIGKLIDDNVNLSEYSCSPNCNYLTGRVWEGQICPICHQVVKNNYDITFDHNGFIDIGEYHCIQPAAFAKINELIGSATLDTIINFENVLDIDGNIGIGVGATKKNPFVHIGMIEFYKRYEEIISYFGRIKKKQRDADFLIRMKNRIWTSKLNVLSQELRPAFINSSEKTMRYDKLNQTYAIIISNAALIAKAKITAQYMNINKYLYTIQKQMYELYFHVVSKLDGKMKLPRRNIQGTKMSWSSRLVITANIGENYGIDQIVVSYKCFLELYKYEIMNCMKRGIACSQSFINWTLYEIAEWIDVQRYANVVEPNLYSIMKWLIDNTKEGLWCIVNRPPTMDLGSIQVLRITDVIPNAIENNMKVPLTSLVAWNGDFDGDTLSIYSLKEANVAKAFRDAFNPKHLINNKISGYKIYNDVFGLPKDLFMFLFPFVPEISEEFSKKSA